MPDHYTFTSTLPLADLKDEPGRQRALKRHAILDGDRDHRFDKIVALVRDVLDVPIATVSLIDNHHQRLMAHAGIDGGICPRASAFCNVTIQSREVMVVENALLDPRFADNCHVTGDPFVRSYAGAPLITHDGYNLGALCAIDRAPRRFPKNHLTILQRFAALVVTEMELRTAAHEDYLTRVMTRRAFLGQLTNVLLQSCSGGRRVDLVMFDIDHFKQVNDNYGHGMGDEILCAVADVIRGELRAGESFGRLGGEEFAVLTSNADACAAFERAERFRTSIAALRTPGRPPITASFGIASIRKKQSVAECLAAADEALYLAKRSGRNCCVPARCLYDGAAAA